MKKEKLLRIDLMDIKEIEIVNLVVVANKNGSFVDTEFDGKELLYHFVEKAWGNNTNVYYPHSRYYICEIIEYDE